MQRSLKTSTLFTGQFKQGVRKLLLVGAQNKEFANFYLLSRSKKIIVVSAVVVVQTIVTAEKREKKNYLFLPFRRSVRGSCR